MIVPNRLPKPDQFGNYWLGNRLSQVGPVGPAIFTSKKLTPDGVLDTGAYIVFLGSDRGFMFQRRDDGEPGTGMLVKFRTAAAALVAAEEELQTWVVSQ